MEPFTIITSSLLPLPYDDVDTDQIIPAAYLKVTGRQGLVEGLFARWRYRPDGSLEPAFALNRSEYRQAAILLAGDNFGCGSSREHAPWALLGWGFRAVITTSFADIFCSNALKNGLLPVVVGSETHQQLFELVEAEPAATVTIDLAQQTVTLPDGRTTTFPIDPFSKGCLLAGVDQLGYLLRHETQIAAYEAASNPQS
jgi:3-isopropylmalate/(R)-2-methylmalate dehydratase small subunit